MRNILVLIGLIINFLTYGQNVVHTSNHILAVNGSWDINRDPKRAQFVSGNRNIQALFINNYQLTLERIHRVKSGFVELEFVVKSDGKLDSINFIKHDDYINDLEAVRLLVLTDGAWRPGRIDGNKLSEKMIIRYYFSDNAKEKNVDKKMVKANDSFAKNSFDDCIRYCNQALEINPFETEALKLKGISLFRIGRKDESCEVLKLAQSYYAENIEVLVSNSCE